MLPCVHLPDAGAAVDRRGDRGVAELRARAVDLRLILLHLRLELRHRAPSACRPAAPRCRRSPRASGSARDRRGRWPDCAWSCAFFATAWSSAAWIGARVDAREHVARVDVLALLEPHLDQRAVHHRLDGHGVERLHRAEPVEVDRHVLASRSRRPAPGSAGSRAVAPRRLARTRAGQNQIAQPIACEHKQAEQQRITPRRQHGPGPGAVGGVVTCARRVIAIPMPRAGSFAGCPPTGRASPPPIAARATGRGTGRRSAPPGCVQPPPSAL